jgi:rubrerythrin
MGVTFNADEIYTLAEQIERNGAAFYRKCAQNNPSEAKLLDGLAEMEDGHLEVFQGMHRSVTEKESELTAFDPDGTAGLYLREMAGGCVFNTKQSPADVLSGNESLQDILKTAIGLEKDSIVFYLGMKEMVPKSLGKGKIEAIIQEEMKHVTMLSQELRKAGGA